VRSKAQLKEGDWALVMGASGGLGSIIVQAAASYGANIIAAAGADERVEAAKKLGAQHGINYRKQDLTEEVIRLTGKRGVDVVFEHVGTATWEQSILSLATGGRLVTCGATTGFAAQLDLRYLFARQLSLLGSYMGSRAELYTVLKLVGEKRLRPVIDRVFPLDQAMQAHQRLEQREQFGKIVLRA
jgi:NADPH:quinone reductase-like Zn-dependent oxidoreductase